jgi:hypothetical protein
MEPKVTQLPLVDMPESDFDKSLALPRKELLGLWGMSVMNAPAYVYLALKSDGFIGAGGEDLTFDMGSFCHRWTAGEMSTGTEREKELKPKHVLTALALFDEKDIAEMPSLGKCLKMHGV